MARYQPPAKKAPPKKAPPAKGKCPECGMPMNLCKCGKGGGKKGGGRRY